MLMVPLFCTILLCGVAFFGGAASRNRALVILCLLPQTPPKGAMGGTHFDLFDRFGGRDRRDDRGPARTIRRSYQY